MLHLTYVDQYKWEWKSQRSKLKNVAVFWATMHGNWFDILKSREEKNRNIAENSNIQEWINEWYLQLKLYPPVPPPVKYSTLDYADAIEYVREQNGRKTTNKSFVRRRLNNKKKQQPRIRMKWKKNEYETLKCAHSHTQRH